MTDNLSLLEEFDAERRLKTPHLLYSKKNPSASKNIAFVVLAKKDDEILLINSIGFEDSAVIAGLSEKHIEILAKHGPQEYKQYLADAVRDEVIVSEIMETAKDMDEDLGSGVSANQQRVGKVMQYIRDNWVVFQF